MGYLTGPSGVYTVKLFCKTGYLTAVTAGTGR